MHDITIDDVMSWKPCPPWTRESILEASGGRESLNVVEVLGLDIDWCDRLWVVFRAPFFTERQLRLLACDFAEHVLWIAEKHDPDDLRPREAIAVARRHAEGAATNEELIASQDAAWAAERAARAAVMRSVAWTESRSAAWARTAARTAARDASWAATQDAAQDAIWATGWTVVWDARHTTALAEAWAAARTAMHNAEIAWQKAKILEALDGHHD